jgi:hypothetical protein
MEWIGRVKLKFSCYSPGRAVCPFGGYNNALERLCVSLCVTQQQRGWEGEYVINSMHVKADGTTHHLLLIGPFDFATTLVEEMADSVQRQMQSMLFEPHLYFYMHSDNNVEE